MALALLNMAAMVVFLTDASFKRRPEIQSGFFRNLIGLAYTAFLAITLFSFLWASDLPEAAVNFAKIFTTFAATYALYVIFSSNHGYVLPIALAMTALLLFDCLTVFYHILGYINHSVVSIIEIKSIYSNKNILSAALFVKIPAALWLMLFTDKWKQKTGYLAFFAAALAVLFMSTRSFILGLGFLVIALALFYVIRRFFTTKNLPVKKTLQFVCFLVFALTLYTVTQKYLYPKNKDKYNVGVAGRLATISAEESSANARLTNWARSIQLIRDNPVLGAGTGNWKINVLKYESPAANNFIISYKNHNDFLEVAAETGIPGGLIYISIFFLIVLAFARTVLKRETDEETLKYLFLPAFGILAYSVDAFFNFPNDRPEMQSLFAMFVALGIAFSGKGFSLDAFTSRKETTTHHKSVLPFYAGTGIAFLALVASAIILSMYARSLQMQRYVFYDEKHGTYKNAAVILREGFPPLPDLSWNGAPIITTMSHYLIHENRSAEAVSLLMAHNPSPYDGRREYYLAMAYEKLGKQDSLIYWGKKLMALKPLFADIAHIVSSRQFGMGRQEEAMQTINSLLAKVKTNPEAWLQAADQYLRMGKGQEATRLMDSATKYLPRKRKIANTRKLIRNTVYKEPFASLYDRANDAYLAKRYAEAMKGLNEFIAKRPDFTQAYQTRSVCYFFLGEYAKSLKDVQTALDKGDGNEAFLINLRGVNNKEMGKMETACQDFKLSMEKGSAEGESNYRKFCGQDAKGKAE
jgi:O-antigen ligase